MLCSANLLLESLSRMLIMLKLIIILNNCAERTRSVDTQHLMSLLQNLVIFLLQQKHEIVCHWTDLYSIVSQLSFQFRFSLVFFI